MLVMALEANAEVPKMEVVTERLMHEERRQKDRAEDTYSEKAMTIEQRTRRKVLVRCHYCKRFGHMKRDCFELAERKSAESSQKERKHRGNKAEVKRRDSSSSESESVGLVTRHALSASVNTQPDSWVIDSGATCHMCNDDKLFNNIQYLKEPQEVTLGDGHILEAIGIGVVELQANLADEKTRRCKPHDVLYVPQLSYNLFSVSRATEMGKTTSFDKANCQVFDANEKLVATGSKIGYLNCQTYSQQVNVADNQCRETKEDVWHRRLGTPRRTEFAEAGKE